MVDNALGRVVNLSNSGYQLNWQYTGGYAPGIITGTGADWFGPLNPQAPSAPAEVAGRRFDYPSGYNLNIAPRAYESISFDQLRALADSYDVLRTIIETRKDQMEALKWSIKPRLRNGQAMTGTDDPLIQEITDFFEMPDGENFWNTWLRQLLEDLFVLDAPVTFAERARNGKLVHLNVVDGATIKRVIDDYGRTPQPPVVAYQQNLHGLPAVNYTTDDLFYRPRNPRSHKVYGYGPVEQILMTVNIALRRQVFLLNYYTEGNVPEALIGAPDGWSSKEIKDFQEWLDTTLSGNLSARRKMRMVPNGIGKTYIDLKSGALTDQTDEWLTRICCFAFSVTPTPFVKQVNRATAGNAQEQALEEGLAPVQNWVAQYVNYVIRREWKTNKVEFGWDEQDEIDPEAQERILVGYTDSGIMKANEARDKLGLDPDPSGDVLRIKTATGAVAVDAQIAADEAKLKMPEPLVAPGVNENGLDAKKPGAVPDSGGNDPGPTEPPGKGVSKAADAPFVVDAADPLEPHVTNAIVSVKATVMKAFRSVGPGVAQHVFDMLTQLNKAIGPEDQVDLSGLNVLVDPIEEQLQAVAAETGGRVIAQVGGPTKDDLTNQVNQRANDYARERSTELVGMKRNAAGDLVPNPNAKYAITDSTRNMIRDLITQGLDEKWGNRAIADAIEKQVFDADRAQLIAFTEIGNANSVGAISGLRAGKSAGADVKKKWSTALDEDVDETICLLNQLEGPIDLEVPFQSGHMQPLGHPRCRCRLVGVVKL